MTSEAETGVMWWQPRNAWGPQELEAARLAEGLTVRTP